MNWAVQLARDGAARGRGETLALGGVAGGLWVRIACARSHPLAGTTPLLAAHQQEPVSFWWGTGRLGELGGSWRAPHSTATEVRSKPAPWRSPVQTGQRPSYGDPGSPQNLACPKGEHHGVLPAHPQPLPSVSQLKRAPREVRISARDPPAMRRGCFPPAQPSWSIRAHHKGASVLSPWCTLGVNTTQTSLVPELLSLGATPDLGPTPALPPPLPSPCPPSPEAGARWRAAAGSRSCWGSARCPTFPLRLQGNCLRSYSFAHRLITV